MPWHSFAGVDLCRRPSHPLGVARGDDYRTGGSVDLDGQVSVQTRGTVPHQRADTWVPLRATVQGSTAAAVLGW